MEEIFRDRKVKLDPKEDNHDFDTLIVTQVTKDHDHGSKYTTTDKGTGINGSYNDPLTKTSSKENSKFQETAKSATLLFAVGDKGAVGKLLLDGEDTSYSTVDSLLQKFLTSYESERFTHAITVKRQRYQCNSKAVFPKMIKEKRNKYFFIANEDDEFHHMTSKIHRYVCSPRKDYYACQKRQFTGRGRKVPSSLNGKVLRAMLERILKHYIMKSEGRDLFSLSTKVILPDFIFEQFPRPHRTTVILRNQLMETPMMRLFSFRDWPNSSSVSAIRLSSAGFFCQDAATETVECCSCDLSLKVSELRGLDPMTYHVQRSPDCVFVQQNANQEVSHSTSLYKTNEDKSFSDAAVGFGRDLHERKKRDSLMTDDFLTTDDMRNRPMLDLHQELNSKQLSNNLYDASLSNWSENRSPLRQNGDNGVNRKGTLLTQQNQNSSLLNISENIRDIATDQNLERTSTSSSSKETSLTRFDISSPDNVSTISNSRSWDANGSYRMDIARANRNDYSHSNQSSETAATRTLSYSNMNSPDRTAIDNNNITRGAASTLNQNIDYPPRNPNFKSKSARQATFRYWHQESKPNSDDLAEAGFYYTGDADTVRCFQCDIGLADWKQEDDPWVEHARHSSECPFLTSKRDREFIDHVQIEWRKVYIPKHKHMADYTKRLQTFHNSSWPRDYVLQTPQMIATAGFFYTGEGDTVRCHYCDGGLRQWEPHDDPWSEHARWFPFCKFVIRTKGIEFIRNAATENTTDEPTEPPNGDASAANVPLIISYEDQCRRKEQRNPMFSAAAQSLKFCFGYSNTKIRNAINIYIERTGRRDFKGVDLVEIVLDKEEEGYSLSSDDEDNTMKPNNQPAKTMVGVGGGSEEEDEFQFSPGAIKREYERLLTLRTCVICKSRERSIIYVPCGHRLVCEQCSADQYTCNHCKTTVTQRIKTYFA